MKQFSLGSTFLLLLACTTLAACGERVQPAPTASNDATQPSTALGQKVRQATDKARAKLATQNISISNNEDGLPKAEISPQGDLLIGGKTIAIDQAQRKLLLQHRANAVALAEAGIEVGVYGADLGARAAGEALRGIFTGNTDQIEKRVEAEAEKIKGAAQRLCDLLPAMRDSQQAVAAAIPQFKPYATMDQADIDDCLVDKGKSYDAGKDLGRALAELSKDSNTPAAPEVEEGDAAARADAAAAKR